MSKEDVIEFRIAYKSANSVKSEIKTDRLTIAGQQLYVSRTTALMRNDIASAKKGKTLRYKKEKDGSLVPVHRQHVTFTMTEAGAKKLRAITKNNIRYYLVLFVNAKPVISAQILSEINDGTMVLDGLTESQVKELVEYFR